MFAYSSVLPLLCLLSPSSMGFLSLPLVDLGPASTQLPFHSGNDRDSTGPGVSCGVEYGWRGSDWSLHSTSLSYGAELERDL